jgi:hypothetical protein
MIAHALGIDMGAFLLFQVLETLSDGDFFEQSKPAQDGV